MAHKSRRKKQLKNPIHAKLQAKQNALARQFGEKLKARLQEIRDQRGRIEMDEDGDEVRVVGSRIGKIVR